jgi:hypothetical protein
MRKYTVVILNQLNIKNNKIDKDNFEKNHKKNHVGKHCSNLQCFMRKFTVVILNQLNIKNNKIDKDNLKKNHKKIMWSNIVAIHSVLKKQNYETKFSTSSI